MAQEKITFEQFITAVDTENKSFVQDLHDYLLENGCKVAFEEKKNGYLASYKYGKPPKAFLNFVFRKHGMLTRIYGERIDNYPIFFTHCRKKWWSISRVQATASGLLTTLVA